MQYILTIAIPTYNRKEKLKMSLSGVLEQVENLPIEILISDNASEDGTEAYMAELCMQYKNLRYHRNNVNIGPDMNFLNCYEMAQGEYVWLLGDDDFVLPGAVQNIVSVLEKKPICVFLNSSAVVRENPLKWSKPCWKELGNKEYENADVFLEEIGILITFLSAFISKTSLVKEINDKEQYSGTYFIQSHIALNVLKNKGKYIIDTYNCLAASINETVSYDLYEVWICQLYRLFVETGVNCGLAVDNLKEIYKQELLTTVLGFVLRFRQTCINENKWKKEYLEEYVREFPIVYNILRMAAYCPKWLLRPLYIIHVVIVKFYGFLEKLFKIRKLNSKKN